MSQAVHTEIYESKPEWFRPDVEVAACYLKAGDKCLFLKRNLDKSEGGRWGVPGGKLDLGETPLKAAVRELKEETQIIVDSKKILYLDALYIRKPSFVFIYHLFYLPVPECLPVTLNAESLEYLWIEEHALDSLPLVGGGLDLYLRCMKRKEALQK